MRHPRLTLAAVTTAVLLVTAACGGTDTTSDTATSGSGSSGSDSRRSVDVDMVDIAFRPAELTVARGETVTFRFTNTGKLAHDAFIGDKDAQADHEKEMGGSHGDHGAAKDAVTVAPGKKAQLTHTFDRAGAFEIGCHQPGHYAAGMKIAVTVT
jgi:uncharacterized cupredoxin-like copper-binding protein